MPTIAPIQKTVQSAANFRISREPPTLVFIRQHRQHVLLCRRPLQFRHVPRFFRFRRSILHKTAQQRRELFFNHLPIPSTFVRCYKPEICGFSQSFSKRLIISSAISPGVLPTVFMCSARISPHCASRHVWILFMHQHSSSSPRLIILS